MMMGEPLDPEIWHAIAGATFHIPTVNSRVYYIPLCHAAEAVSLPQNLSSSVPVPKTLILCTISSVQLLADPITDEVFAKLNLIPLTNFTTVPNPPAASAAGDDDKIVTFSKTLTSYDVNQGGGFPIPRSCAEFIFPELELPTERPAQVIDAIDVHGKAWKFRHIYSNDQHILTTGWSNFVDSKNLAIGDSVVFMKKLVTGKMGIFIGIRRTLHSKKLLPETVAKEIELALQNKPFEVVYYPMAWWPEFVVKAEDVEKAMEVEWGPGMKVKMAAETGDLSRIIWVWGTVSKPRVYPWPMLEITSDESEVLKNALWVGPWEIKLVTPANHAACSPVLGTEDINK